MRFQPMMILLHPAMLPVAVFVVAWWDASEECRRERERYRQKMNARVMNLIVTLGEIERNRP